MQLTVIQYDVIMQAIELYKGEIDDNMATIQQNPKYTADELVEAIDQIRVTLINDNIPL